MIKILHTNLAILMATFTLNGCATHHENFQPPVINVPTEWSFIGKNEVDSISAQPWWKEFKDDELNLLIDEALKRNNTLAIAAIRLQRSRLHAGLSNAATKPKANVSLNSNVSQESGIRSHTNSLSHSVSYEIDFWRKLESAKNADEWEASASQSDCQGTALALIDTTVSLYWQLAELNQRIAFSEEDISSAEETLTIVRAKYTVGKNSDLEVAQAEKNLSDLQASHALLIKQIVETRHAMAILFNRPPENWVIERTTLLENVPDIHANIPASLLANRPDLKAKEFRIRSALSNVEVQKASFYPSFTLTGSMGTSSSTLSKILQNPMQTIGGELVLPFLQWDKTKLNIKISESSYTETVTDFQQSLYSALAEVEDSLSARKLYKEQEVILLSSLSSVMRAESLTKIRYENGAIPIQNWLDAKQKTRVVRLSVIENLFNQIKNHIKLQKALGGNSELFCAEPKA